MLEKLHGVEEKYLDLEAKLSDPDVVSDPEQYLKYAKAHAKLQEIVTVYREYKEQKALYDDDMAVADENSDPELAEMAREEAESLKPVLEDYEIDVEQGIERSKGVEPYITLLRVFYECIDEVSGELDRYRKGGELGEYTIRIHSLKSSARIIGAADLLSLIHI